MSLTVASLVMINLMKRRKMRMKQLREEEGKSSLWWEEASAPKEQFTA